MLSSLDTMLVRATMRLDAIPGRPRRVSGARRPDVRLRLDLQVRRGGLLELLGQWDHHGAAGRWRGWPCRGRREGVSCRPRGQRGNYPVLAYSGATRENPMRLSTAGAITLFVAAVVGCEGPKVAQQASAGCGKDMDCKGDRICESGRCTTPPSPNVLTIVRNRRNPIGRARQGRNRLRTTRATHSRGACSGRREDQKDRSWSSRSSWSRTAR